MHEMHFVYPVLGVDRTKKREKKREREREIWRERERDKFYGP